MGQPLTLDEVEVAPESAAQVIYDLRRRLAMFEHRWRLSKQYLSEVPGMTARVDAAFSHEDHANELRELNAIKRWAESFFRWSQNTVEDSGVE